MRVQKDFNLRGLNTFGISAFARYFTEIADEKEISDLFQLKEFKENERLFLGGGSNVLFTKDFPGIVVLNKLKGIEIVSEDEDTILVRSMGGVIWHDLVLFAVERKYWGIENLAYIPGTAGAASVQNIGAYGVEIKDVLENVEAYDISSGEKRIFKKDDCQFGYRESIFKNEYKNRVFISSITLRLSKKEKKFLQYEVLKKYLEKNKIIVSSPKDICDAVISIRKGKLPDPSMIGNAGSFFKNVCIILGQKEGKETFEELVRKYSDMPFWSDGNTAKIPAAWLIEKCGWKGKRIGNVGVHEKQALVLVNFGGADGSEIKNLSEDIISSVYSKFGLTLEREVNLI